MVEIKVEYKKDIGYNHRRKVGWRWHGIAAENCWFDKACQQALQRLGLNYTRPTYTLKKADPEKQESFKKDFQDIKRSIIYAKKNIKNN